MYTNPTMIAPEADKRDLDHKMCSSYTDGSKLCVEMAVLANGLDLRTAKPGMYGPRMASIHDIFDHFDFEAHLGRQDRPGGLRPRGQTQRRRVRHRVLPTTLTRCTPWTGSRPTWARDRSTCSTVPTTSAILRP